MTTFQAPALLLRGHRHPRAWEENAYDRPWHAAAFSCAGRVHPLPLTPGGPGPGPETAGRRRQHLSLPVSSQLCSVVTLVPQGRRPPCGCAGAGRQCQGSAHAASSGLGRRFGLSDKGPRPGETPLPARCDKRRGTPAGEAAAPAERPRWTRRFSDPRPLPGSRAGRAWSKLPTSMCSSVLYHVAVKCPPARVRPPETLTCLQKSLQEGPGFCDAVKSSTGSFMIKGGKKPHLQAGLTQASASRGRWGPSPGTGVRGAPPPEKGAGGTWDKATPGSPGLCLRL